MPASPELAFASLSVLGRKLRAGEITAVELGNGSLDRLEGFAPRFNAVTAITRDLAIEQAERADRELARGRDRGPLHGIPFGAKDLLATRGTATTWGAAPLRDQVFDDDAQVIERLREAGAVLVAKLAMVELSGALGLRATVCVIYRAGNQPLGPGVLDGRLVLRLRFGRSRGAGAFCHRIRNLGLTDRSSRLLWNSRPPPDLRAGKPARRHAGELDAR